VSIGVLAMTAVFAAMLNRWISPVMQTSGQRFDYGMFDIHGIVVFGYAMFALVLGIFAGAVTGRCGRLRRDADLAPRRPVLGLPNHRNGHLRRARHQHAPRHHLLDQASDRLSIRHATTKDRAAKTHHRTRATPGAVTGTHRPRVGDLSGPGADGRPGPWWSGVGRAVRW
jgi:hypothetical protein